MRGIQNSNGIKLIGMISMLLDHIGYFLFPNVAWLRIVGRPAFPIFAYFIAEGCFYTRNKQRYLLQILILGLVFMGVVYGVTGEKYGNVLVTFSLSIVVIYTYEWMRRKWEGKKMWEKALYGACFAVVVFLIGILSILGNVDYGFYGAMLPFFAYMVQKSSSRGLKLGAFAVGILLLAINYGGVQYYSLLALPILALYNGERGSKSWKYAFYVFYPLHVVIIQGIAMLV